MNNDLLSSGISAYISGNFDSAEACFRQTLQSSPSHPQALYFLGLIAMDKGIKSEACRLLYQATLADRNNKDYKYTLAVALQENNKTDEAISIYEKISDMPEAQNNLGNIYRMQGDLQKSRSSFDKAIELEPKMIWAYLNKALLERQEGKLKESEALLLKTLEIDDNFVQALYQLSIHNRLNKNIKNSLQYIEKAINSNKKIDFLWVEYGKVLNELSQTKDALIAFENAIELNRFCVDAYFEKAQILEKTDPTSAEQAYRNVLNIDAKNIASYNNLGSLLYKENRITEALEMYRNVILIDPQNAYAAFNLAIALENLEDFEEAAGLYFKVLGQNQLQQEIHIRLANMLPDWFKKDAKKAQTYAEGWIKNFPDNPLAIHTNNALTGNISTDNEDFAYSQTFYNAFAETYDNKMEILNCKIPELVAQAIKNKYFKKVLDLGCGTGACGNFLKKQSECLIGVDASEKMVQIAKGKDLYNELYTQDISDFLSENKTLFNLVVSADVFCYINNLKEIFKLIHKSILPNGRFIFTIEKSPKEDDIILQPYGRYQHGLNLIINMLKDACFENINYKEVTLRQEKGKDCIGYLIECQKGS